MNPLALGLFMNLSNNNRTLSIAHSPDTDDYFQFWAIRNKLIDTRNLDFSFATADTQELNNIARTKQADVVAVSAAYYRQLKPDYLVLTAGASIGRNYGPVIVAERDYTIADLGSLRIGIPGETTTAYAILKKIIAKPACKTYPLTPYHAIFDGLSKGEIDAALLIHEGQILYKQLGLHPIVNLGEWWHAAYNLPLPLGINVIRRSLSSSIVADFSQLLEDSMRYALAHQDDIINDMLTTKSSSELDGANDKAISTEELNKYLSMYANLDSIVMSGDQRHALSVLLSEPGENMFTVDYAGNSKADFR